MKTAYKILAAAGITLAALGSTSAMARDHISFGLSIGVPAPVYAAPAPVYVQPQPYYAPPPVVYRPAPVYVAPAPVYYGPGYYGPSAYYGYGYRHHHHGGWR